MNKNYNWLLKKTPRSVDQLKLWPQNPRLNPEESHLKVSDFAESMTDEDADKKDFYALVNSLVADGFVPADPIVVWKNDANNKYYVAEGNRRVIALKLLRNPKKAPKSIRNFIRTTSSKINISDYEKIPVNVAPSFEDAEWYINQRNSSSSLQRRWSRVQQQRWIVTLYEKHNGDLNKILNITKLSKGELEGFFRILKIKDFVKLPQVKDLLSIEEFEFADSYKFPITILERFFNFTIIREKWGIEFEGININIVCVKSSFYIAFASLIKKIVSKELTTRFTKDDLEDILSGLPDVEFKTDSSIEEEEADEQNNSDNTGSNDSETNNSDNNQDNQSNNTNGNSTNTNNGEENLKGDPDRGRLVLSFYDLNTDSYRLKGLFKEFKKIPFSYPNHIASSLRVFLDLSVLNYIKTEELENLIKSTYKDELKNIPIKKRLEYIKTNKLKGKAQNIVGRLIDPSQQFSLDVLNGYIHGEDTHYLNKQFLNGFWDFLFPLFQELLTINEN